MLDHYFHRNSVLGDLVAISPKRTDMFLAMNWTFVHAEEQRAFITCDNPIATLPLPGYVANDPFGRRLDSPLLLKLVALAGDTCLLMSGHGAQRFHRDSHNNEIRRLNVAIAEHTIEIFVGGAPTTVRNLADGLGLSSQAGSTTLGQAGSNGASDCSDDGI